MKSQEIPQWRNDLAVSPLHQDIRETLRVGLHLMPRESFLTFHHLGVQSTDEKLSILRGMMSMFAEHFNGAAIDRISRSARKFFPRIARTVTCHRDDGVPIGLVTSFLDRETEFSPEMVRTLLRYAKLPRLSPKNVLWNYPDERYMNATGAEEGYVGPWARMDTGIPLYVFNDDQHQYADGEHAVVDFALAKDRSLLMLDQPRAGRFIRTVNEGLNRPRTVFMNSV